MQTVIQAVFTNRSHAVSAANALTAARLILAASKNCRVRHRMQYQSCCKDFRLQPGWMLENPL